MEFVDLSRSVRLPVQMELLTASSRMGDPGEVLDLFLAALRRVHGPRGSMVISRRGLGSDEYRIVLVMGPDGRHLLSTPDPWVGRGARAVCGGVIGQIIAEPRPRLVHHLDVQGDPVVGDDWAGYRSLMAVPIFDRGQPLNWLIMLDAREEGCRLEERAWDRRCGSGRGAGDTARDVPVAAETGETRAGGREAVAVGGWW